MTRSTDFTEIAARYEHDSLIQKSAAEKLLELVEIKENDSVLDLGCGAGNVTRKIRAMTKGAVVGADASTGMIHAAENERHGLDITYQVRTAEELDYRDVFDVIFCNSTFQWFHDPMRALKNCHAALVKGGRMGIQAPAKKVYCPNFLKAVEAVCADPRTAKTFSGFRPPWTFLCTADEYSSLFKRCGFAVPFAIIEEIKTLHPPDQVMTIFESGAAAGYLNREYYREPIDGPYSNAFREIVKKSFHSQADATGKVALTFNRIYLLAVKQSLY